MEENAASISQNIYHPYPCHLSTSLARVDQSYNCCLCTEMWPSRFCPCDFYAVSLLHGCQLSTKVCSNLKEFREIEACSGCLEVARSQICSLGEESEGGTKTCATEENKSRCDRCSSSPSETLSQMLRVYKKSAAVWQFIFLIIKINKSADINAVSLSGQAHNEPSETTKTH